MIKKDYFQDIVNNALDFLNSAIDEIDTQPKFSVIHFCTAIELFLKSKLLLEHWSLIYSDPKLANVNDFLNGNFHSVNMDNTINRLINICKINFSKEEKACYNKIVQHRNKLIHFYHPDYRTNPNKQIIEDIVIEECRAWYYLKNHLLNHWKAEYQSFNSKLLNADKGMLKMKLYLKTRFELLGLEIKILSDKGAKIITCESCGFNSEKCENIKGPVNKGECLVCGNLDLFLDIKCPHCQTNTSINSDDHRCLKCKEELDIDTLVFEFNGLQDPSDPEIRPYCGLCEFFDSPSVIMCDDFYLCVNCFEMFESIEICNYCGEYIAGRDLSDSYLSGCMMCEGVDLSKY